MILTVLSQPTIARLVAMVASSCIALLFGASTRSRPGDRVAFDLTADPAKPGKDKAIDVELLLP
jgi:hypothetical protein